MQVRGANFEALIAAMDAAIQEFTERLKSDSSIWTRGKPGQWSIGQHADHIAVGLEITADAFDRSAKELGAGTLTRPPSRWPLEALFIGVVVGAERFPRGGRAPRSILPQTAPDANDVMARIPRAASRFRALGERLTPEERDHLWIPSPFMKGWHYRFPEILRLHAVHTRHHAKLIAEIVAACASAHDSVDSGM